MLFEWDPNKFSVSVTAMDSEHKMLISLMNRLHELHQKKAPTSELAPAFEKLGAFTLQHFANEERYMGSVKFAGLDTHRMIHQNLAKRLSQFAADFKSGKPLSDEFFTFLKVWLSAHIQGVDRQYSPGKQPPV